MKKVITTEDLKISSYYDAPAYLDEGYILLSPDTMVTPELKNRLQRWDYASVYSEGRPKDTPAFQSATEEAIHAATLDTDIKERQRFEQARYLYVSLFDFTRDFFDSFNEHNSMDLEILTKRIKELIEAIKTSRDYVLCISEYVQTDDNYLYQHSMNTAVLSLAIGDTLKLPPHRLIELGIAAFLHDVGMFKIPGGYFLKSRTLDPQERKMINAHAMLGYRILKGFSLAEEIALAALEHHERLDGSGYPNSLVGERIGFYSKIIAVGCSYDAMVSNRPFKSVKDGHRAIMELYKDRKKRYDDTAVRTLIYLLSLFPVGTILLLSDRSIGRVVRVNPKQPKLPTVKLLLDSGGKPLDQQMVVQTSEEDGVSVSRALTTAEVQKLPPEALK